jgi:hypothetical protein
MLCKNWSVKLSRTGRHTLLFLVLKIWHCGLLYWVVMLASCKLGTSPAMALIYLKRIYNFWCSMLVFTPFALCFVTFHGIFMRFLEVTYWQDATVSVPCFLLFLCFKKATQEIFSKLDETSSRSLIFPGRVPKTEREPEGGQGPASHQGGAAQPLATPPMCGKPLAAP